MFLSSKLNIYPILFITQKFYFLPSFLSRLQQRPPPAFVWKYKAQCYLSVGWETTYFITLEKAYGMTVTIMTIVINKIIQVGQICLISWVKQEILICVWQRKIHILSKRKNILPDSWAPDCSAQGPRHLAGWSSDWRGATASFLSPSQTSQCPAKPAKQRFPHFYYLRWWFIWQQLWLLTKKWTR